MKGNNGTRKCFHCSEFKSTIKNDSQDQHCIGYCRKYNLKVIDTLCGCQERDGETTLFNFTEK